MPELPECETIVRSLRPDVVGKVIDSFIVSPGNKLSFLPEILVGRTIASISRWGKYIIFNLDDGGLLISHLRMTGNWVFSPEGPGVAVPHFRWSLVLKDTGGRWAGFINFTDVRKFGTIEWAPSVNNYKPFLTLGPDGLSLANPLVIKQVLKRALLSKRPIKNFILDQTVMAGTGNWSACEILYYMGVNPLTPSREVDIALLCKTAYYIFCKAIFFRGTSFSDYVDGRGEKGSFQNHLQVYGRAGEPCYCCQAEIFKIKVGGRSTFFCPECQPEGPSA